MVLAVSNHDPATVYGATNVLLNMLKYTAPISPCGNVRLRVPVNGDQGYCEKNRKGVDSRTEVEDPNQRLSPLLPLPQEWHAQKVSELTQEIIAEANSIFSSGVHCSGELINRTENFRLG